MIFVFTATSCRWKVLGIWTEAFWIRDDFLHEVTWKERHPICKIRLVNTAFRTWIPHPNPSGRNNKGHKRSTHTSIEKFYVWKFLNQFCNLTTRFNISARTELNQSTSCNILRHPKQMKVSYFNTDVSNIWFQ